ncbi:hypothetical protein Hdeb2414_s0029g00704891 [Helianthus debilis subsp. tardiflorus]
MPIIQLMMKLGFADPVNCNHPKTVEDFFRERSPGSSKLQRSAGVSEIIRSSDRNKRYG